MARRAPETHLCVLLSPFSGSGFSACFWRGFCATSSGACLIQRAPVRPQRRRVVLRRAIPVRRLYKIRHRLFRPGLCFLSPGYRDKIPRTVDTLARWSLVIPVGELEPGDLVFFDLQAKGGASSAQAPTSVSQAASLLTKADHVGIYIGGGFFIHAASSGPHTGVIQSSFNDSEWKQRLLFAGRALPTSTLSGFAFDWGASVSFAQLETLEGGPLAFVRGLSGWGEVSFPLSKNFSAGLRAGAAWDRYLGVVRVPVELDIGQISGLSVFAGPALTLGAPDMNGRLYSPGDFFIATGGLRWSPLFFSSGAQRFGTYFELRYDYYVPEPGQVEALQTDLRSCLNFSIGIRLRTVKY